MTRSTPEQLGGVNRCAFLDMIARSEGTATIAGSDDGYNVLVGGTLFDGYADHPNMLVRLSDKLSSTAAGRYQLLHRYWVAYKDQLGLKDFSPESQDRVALQQIKERGALAAIDNGRFGDAVALCRNIWASLPGAGYGQRENSLASLEQAYIDAGGIIAAA